MIDPDALVDLVCTECHQTFKAEPHHRVCPSCVEEHMAMYDDDDMDDDRELEDDFDCGLMRDG